MVICLERDADLHTARLMPLPLTVSCFTKIQIGFTFLVPAHLGSPGKGPLNGCVTRTVQRWCIGDYGLLQNTFSEERRPKFFYIAKFAAVCKFLPKCTVSYGLAVCGPENLRRLLNLLEISQRSWRYNYEHRHRRLCPQHPVRQ